MSSVKEEFDREFHRGWLACERRFTPRLREAQEERDVALRRVAELEAKVEDMKDEIRRHGRDVIDL